MRYLYTLAIAMGLCALTALAGTRAKDSAGEVPFNDGGVLEGVALNDAEGCRLSARVTDGGTINGGGLAVYYYDAVLGWVRSPTSLDCTFEANKLQDGGAPAAQVCPDLGVLAKYGRIAAARKLLVNGAGSPATATVRVECWGRNIP
jgi:hypothetical protein